MTTDDWGDYLALKVFKEICSYLCCTVDSFVFIALAQEMFAEVIRCFDSSGNRLIVTAPPESLCFDSSPSAGEKTAAVCVFVAISRIEIQAS